MNWYPHTTVATVVEQDDRFLMVQEEDAGRIVFNQPAGHLEQGETLFEAARRETLEETGWRVELTGFLGVYCYRSAANGVTYIRHCFTARPLERLPDAPREKRIIDVLWLAPEEILAPSFPARSPLVGRVLEDYRRGIHYPLETVFHHWEQQT